jgi:hypothetical protein
MNERFERIVLPFKSTIYFYFFLPKRLKGFPYCSISTPK